MENAIKTLAGDFEGDSLSLSSIDYTTLKNKVKKGPGKGKVKTKKVKFSDNFRPGEFNSWTMIMSTKHLYA